MNESMFLKTVHYLKTGFDYLQQDLTGIQYSGCSFVCKDSSVRFIPGVYFQVYDSGNWACDM